MALIEIEFQESNRKFTLVKREWDSVALERIEMATDPSKSADLAAVVMQDGLANLCLVTNSLTLVRAKIDINLPRKRRGNTQQHEKAMHKFYEVQHLAPCSTNSCLFETICFSIVLINETYELDQEKEEFVAAGLNHRPLVVK